MKTLFYPIFLYILVSCSQVKPLYSDKPEESKSKVPEKITQEENNEEEAHKIESIAKGNDSLKTSEPKEIKTLTFQNTAKVKKYCNKIDKYFKKYNWGKSNCEDYSWHHVRSSYYGNPIIWYVYGDENAEIKNKTLIFCGVHGDEITPVKFCFDILEDLKNHPEVLKDNLVVIAPLVAPDSFMKKKPTRTNARGVDVNRNFPTKDFSAKAIKLWKSRYGGNKRRFPGKKAMSEQETLFQVNIIKRYNPNKIISVHAPLTLIDYDGPTVGLYGESAHSLLNEMSEKAGKYKVNNYPFFTGSLGNWAGNERGIPTYTLELPNSDWTKTNKFFNMFQKAIHQAIVHDMNVTPVTKKEKISDTEEPEKKSDLSNEKVL